jgi:hypothetical protein
MPVVVYEHVLGWNVTQDMIETMRIPQQVHAASDATVTNATHWAPAAVRLEDLLLGLCPSTEPPFANTISLLGSQV